MANNPFSSERAEYARQHKIAEKELLPIFRKALSRTISRVLQYANDYGLDGMRPEALIDPNIWDLAYQQAFNTVGFKFARREYYNMRNLEGGQKASAIDFLRDVWSGLLRDYSLRYTYQIKRELNETTIELIKRALGNAYELTIDRLGRVRLFEKELKESMRNRALVISRTEATTVSNLGKEIGARSWIEESGQQGYKMWLGRNDEKERKTHLAENNTIIQLEDKFDLSGEECDRPGDVTLSAKERINCRCSVSYMSQNRYNQLVKRGRIVNGKVIG